MCLVALPSVWRVQWIEQPLVGLCGWSSNSQLSSESSSSSFSSAEVVSGLACGISARLCGGLVQNREMKGCSEGKDLNETEDH